MPPDFPYRKLPGSLRGFVRKASLWEGSDHFLSVTGTRFSEKYRRFYYRDIQAFVLDKSPRMGSFGLWSLAAIAFLVFFLLALRYRSNIVLSAGAALWLLVVVARIVITLRFSCRCYIQTAVSRELLPSVLRLWKVEPVLGRLRPRIADAQGTLPEDLSELLSRASVPPQTISIATPASSGVASPDPEPFRRAVNLAVAGFVLCLLDAASCFYSLIGPPAILNSAAMKISYGLLMLLQGGAIAFALLGIHHSRPLRSLRNFLAAGLCFTGLEVFLSTSLTQLLATQKQLSNSKLDFTSVAQWAQKIDGSLGVLLGCGGLILILLNWQSFRRGSLSSA